MPEAICSTGLKSCSPPWYFQSHVLKLEYWSTFLLQEREIKSQPGHRYPRSVTFLSEKNFKWLVLVSLCSLSNVYLSFLAFSI